MEQHVEPSCPKFNILRKPTDNELYSNDGQNGWQHLGDTSGLSRPQKGLVLSEKSLDPVKRIPLAFDLWPAINEASNVPKRASLASLDAPFFS